jgi:hypothetical protein
MENGITLNPKPLQTNWGATYQATCCTLEVLRSEDTRICSDIIAESFNYWQREGWNCNPCKCATGWTMRHNGKMQLQPLIACHFFCITRCNTICSSGAIPPLVHLLINRTPHEKKESCCHSSSLTSQYYMRTRDTLCRQVPSKPL